MMRAVIGVIVGYVVWSVLWLGGNAGLALTFAEQGDAFDTGTSRLGTGYLVGALVLSIICSLLAGVVNAAIAAEKTKGAVLTMALLLLATGIAVQAGSWSLMPLWYHLVFLLLLVPVCLAGGRKRAT